MENEHVIEYHYTKCDGLECYTERLPFYSWQDTAKYIEELVVEHGADMEGFYLVYNDNIVYHDNIIPVRFELSVDMEFPEPVKFNF